MKKKVGLIGFGKTGKSVANVILQNQDFSLEWVLRQKKNNHFNKVSDLLEIENDEPGIIFSKHEINLSDLLEKHPVDFIIDFSSSNAIYEYGEIVADKKIKIISAISHYSDEEIVFLKEISKKTTVFWSPNITLGVNYLLYASKFLKQIAPWADIEIIEEHFKTKKGVSGTAIKLADALQVSETEINSVRVGGIVGKHEMIFGFPYQTVRLIHESIAREAFGNGALFVAENLENKEYGFYKFEDILKVYFNNLNLNT